MSGWAGRSAPNWAGAGRGRQGQGGDPDCTDRSRRRRSLHDTVCRPALQDSAESLKARIAFTAGLSSSLQVVNGAGGAVYKVMVGPFSGKAAADAANRKLQGSGISGCIPKKG